MLKYWIYDLLSNIAIEIKKSYRGYCVARAIHNLKKSLKYAKSEGRLTLTYNWGKFVVVYSFEPEKEVQNEV